MNSTTPAPSRFRIALRALWLIPLAAFGYLLAVSPQGAAADGLPLSAADGRVVFVLPPKR